MSKTTQRPSVATKPASSLSLSLFSRRTDGPQWLYLWGDLDAYLLARVRKEAFVGCYAISHPGFFPKFNHLLLAQRRFTLARLPRSANVSVTHSGDIRLMVNEERALHEAGAPGPVRREIDLRPFLKVGANSVYIYCSRIDEPPCLLIEGKILQTDESWTVGRDEMHQEKPALYPLENREFFPHQETLPRARLAPRGSLLADGSAGVIYDFGREVFGYPDITLTAGTAIEIQPGETLAEAQKANQCFAEQHTPPLPGHKGHNVSQYPAALRYLRVQTANGKPIPACELQAPLYPATCRGSFACSDVRLDQIWKTAAYTLHLGMREFLLDGIKRDRLPWVGDAYIGGLANAYSFAEWPVLERTLTAAYGEDPYLTFPNNLLIWALTWVLALDTYRAYAGPTEFLSRSREKLARMMSALTDHEDAAGLLVGDAKAWAWVDWAEIEMDGAVAAIQMMYVMVLEAAANLAGSPGPGQDARAAATYRRKAAGLRSLSGQAFWDARQGAFISCARPGRKSRQVTRHANFLAVLAGAANAAQRKALRTNVLDNPAVPDVTTPHMKFLEARARHVAGDTPGMLDTLHHYWGGMLEQGATTFWEGYSPAQKGPEHYYFYGRPFGKSLCHVWAGGAIYLLSADVLGVRPLSPGFARFTVQPSLAGLEWARGVIPTPSGDITVEVARGKVSVKAPRGLVRQ